VTALSEEHHIVSAKDAGVTAYIVKPFTAAILKKRIDAVLQAT
jgi:DNA-binding response OmpR family regulator